MRFLDDEWYEEYKRRSLAAFTEKGKLNITYLEVYTDCPGPEKTVWIYYVMEESLLKEMKRGYGLDSVPEADYMVKASYDIFAAITVGKMDAVKAIMGRKLSIKGSIKKILAMMPLADKLTEAANIPGMEC